LPAFGYFPSWTAADVLRSTAMALTLSTSVPRRVSALLPLRAI